MTTAITGEASREAGPWEAVLEQLRDWDPAWDRFYELDPAWTDEFIATGAGIYGSGVISAKDVELLSIALDASYTHMWWDV